MKKDKDKTDMNVKKGDIARKAGVSLASVSRVLNNSGYVKIEKKEKILSAARSLGYIPKPSIDSIAVVVPDITNPYFGEIIKGISEAAQTYKVNIMLFNTDDNLEKELDVLEFLNTQKIQGVIMTPNFGGDEFNSSYINKIESLKVPLVLVAADVKYTNLNGVFVDNMNGAFDAVSALIKEGHRKIGIIRGQKTSQAMSDMFIGYKKALSYNNIELNKKYIYYGDFKLDNTYKITKDILTDNDRPTALFISSNMMTLGCIKAVNDLNMKIPDDISIIGFNKINFFNVIDMNISYVDDSAIELGKTSMEMLFEIIQKGNNKDVRRITLKPTIVLKGSEKYIQK